MIREREDFTPEQEAKIEAAVKRIVDGGQDALENIQDITRYCVQLMKGRDHCLEDYGQLERVVKMNREATKRAESIIFEKGKDRVTVLLSRRK